MMRSARGTFLVLYQCNMLQPGVHPICTSTKFHFQFQWTAIFKLSAVTRVVHELSFPR